MLPDAAHIARVLCLLGLLTLPAQPEIVLGAACGTSVGGGGTPRAVGPRPSPLNTPLQRTFGEIAAGIDARVGIAVFLNGSPHPAAAVGAEEMYPMMSVVKLPLAVVILQGVAQGKWDLDQPFTLTPQELPTGTWSPLRDKSPSGGEYTLRELLHYAVAQSDNNVCDYLFALAGGPQVVQSAIREHLESAGILISYDEDGLRDLSKISGNSATPIALCRLLQAIENAACADPGNTARWLLPAAEARELLHIMGETCTGTACLAAGLPAHACLQHKTGSGPILPDGRISAKNDVGIIRMPGGRYACIAVFVADAAADASAVDAVMRRAAEATVRALCE